MVRKAWVLALAAALGGCTKVEAPVSSDRVEEKGEPASILRSFPASPAGGIREPGNSVLRDAKAWEEAWAKANSHRTPVPGAPAVDFAKEMVAFAALGEKPTGGWSVQIVGARAVEGKLTILLSVHEPAAGEAAVKAVARPWHAVVLAKSDLPVEWARYEPPRPAPRPTKK